MHRRKQKKVEIEPQETYSGSKVAYCLLCHYTRKHVFATENNDYITVDVVVVIIVAIQLKLEEKKRTAKCIIIKVNYTIQDAFEEEEEEERKTPNEVQYIKRK